MTVTFSRRAFVSACVAAVFLSLGPRANALISWTNSGSGLWRSGTNWSIGRAPDMAAGLILITNAGTKTVTIDSPTASTNLILNNLTLLAPAGATNTLAMTDVGTNKPLVLLSSASPLAIARGGALYMSNSSLVITGTAVGLTVWAGSVTLDSGSIVVRDEPATTNITVKTRIARTNEASLTINGGLAQFGWLFLGESPGTQFPRSRGTLTMSGGILSVLGELSVAESPGCTGLVFMTGGQIQIPNQFTNTTRIGNYGVGQMTVSNATLLIPNASVGRHDGSSGLLTLQNNAVAVFSDDLSIGRFSGATGSVVVAGGQLITTNQPIWVGREGVGQLTVSNGSVQGTSLLVAAVPTNTARGTFTLAGGTMTLSSNLTLGAASISTGRVAILAGSLDVTNANNTAGLWLASGLLTLNDGTITTDNLTMTNADAQFIFGGGTLITRNSSVANGLPFIVGNGTNAATLELVGGGTHSFANSLIISSNATLIGCGTIVGTIINHGTISTNCGSSSVPPSITQPPMSLTITQGGSAVFSVTAAGSSPLAYQWRFGSADISGATASNYTVASAQSSDAGAYEVVVSNSGGSVTSPSATLRVLVPSSISDSSHIGSTNVISFTSVTGLRYTLEFKNQLDETNWTDVLPPVTGTGSALSIPDPQATVPARFYRLRID